MSGIWAPRPPLDGAAVFLSASVPHPQRDGRFLSGPLDDWLMLRVIDQRVFDAVQCLVAQVLAAGGRLVHGGHPTITNAIAAQVGSWQVPAAAAEAPPVLLYQSQHFAHLPPPPGREPMRSAGLAAVRWTPTRLAELRLDALPLAQPVQLRPEWIADWLPQQAPAGAPPALKEALLVMRLQMLLESQPRAALCIGGMEGIEAEARLYTDLCDHGLLPGDGLVYALGSSFGAAAQLQGERVRLLDDRPPPSAATAQDDLLARLAYDAVIGRFLEAVGAPRGRQGEAGTGPRA